MQSHAGGPGQLQAVTNPTYIHSPPAQQQRAQNTAVNMGEPKRGAAVSTAKANKAIAKKHKKPGCIKKLSHKSQVFQRSDCGTLIISTIRIVLAATSITAVATAFAGKFQASTFVRPPLEPYLSPPARPHHNAVFTALNDNVEDVLSVIDTWRAPPLLEMAVVPQSGACPTAAGWSEVSALTWPGASSHGCGCPQGARSPDNGLSQSSTVERCDGNQTLGKHAPPSTPCQLL